MTDIEQEEMDALRHAIKRELGISVSADKQSFITHRLRPVLERAGVGSYAELAQRLNGGASEELLRALADAVTTNHTFFNRENAHFDLFSQVILPGIEERQRAAGSRSIRIWCAAASTGQEPYTLAMLMLRHFGARYGEWDAGLLATDISTKALTKAREGVYSEEEAGRIPPELKRWFKDLPDGRVKVRDDVKREVLYRRLNLIRPSYPFRGKFQCIFIRNVLIYFDNETTAGVIRRLHDVLEPGGWLLVGLAETIRGDERFQFVQPGAYRRR